MTNDQNPNDWFNSIPDPSTANQSMTKRSNKAKLVVVSLISALLIGGGVALYFALSPQKKASETACITPEKYTPLLAAIVKNDDVEPATLDDAAYSTQFYFESSSPSSLMAISQEELRDLSEKLKNFISSDSENQAPLRITLITAHQDKNETEKTLRASQARVIADALIRAGIPRETIVIDKPNPVDPEINDNGTMDLVQLNLTPVSICKN